MSLPLCIASKILNIKIFLFEPNMVLGRANKLFLNFVKKFFVILDKIKNFPNKLKNKILIITNFIKKRILFNKKSERFQ